MSTINKQLNKSLIAVKNCAEFWEEGISFLMTAFQNHIGNISNKQLLCSANAFTDAMDVLKNKLDPSMLSALQQPDALEASAQIFDVKKTRDPKGYADQIYAKRDVAKRLAAENRKKAKAALEAFATAASNPHAPVVVQKSVVPEPEFIPAAPVLPAIVVPATVDVIPETTVDIIPTPAPVPEIIIPAPVLESIITPAPEITPVPSTDTPTTVAQQRTLATSSEDDQSPSETSREKNLKALHLLIDKKKQKRMPKPVGKANKNKK